MQSKDNKSSKEQVAWCLKKLEEALLDYDVEAAKNYLELSRQWLNK